MYKARCVLLWLYYTVTIECTCKVTNDDIHLIIIISAVILVVVLLGAGTTVCAVVMFFIRRLKKQKQLQYPPPDKHGLELHSREGVY